MKQWTDTQAVADTATQHYVLEIRLDGGVTLHADMGDDLEAARTQLAARGRSADLTIGRYPGLGSPT